MWKSENIKYTNFSNYSKDLWICLLEYLEHFVFFVIGFYCAFITSKVILGHGMIECQPSAFTTASMK